MLDDISTSSAANAQRQTIIRRLEMLPHHNLRLRKFVASEYVVWSIHARAILGQIHALGIVDGTEPRPTTTDQVELEYWDDRHNKAFALLVCSVFEPEIYTIMTMNTAQAVWDALKDAYGHFSEKDMIDDLNQFYDLKKDSRTPLNVHLVRFHGLVNRINYSRANCKRPEPPMSKEMIELGLNRSLFRQ